MAERKKINIVNCHIHTFTTKNVPIYFPHPLASIFRYLPFLVRFLRWLVSLTPYEGFRDWMVRLEKFHRTGDRKSQEAVFRKVLHYYPKSARFVVLPMDMALIGHGKVHQDIRAQHDELHKLATTSKYASQVIPFGTIYPDRPEGVDEFKRCVDDLGFKGLKLYNKMGYAPNHPVMMEKIYPFCVERNIPVMAHCSRGGVFKKGWSQKQRDAVTAPEAWKPVLNAFPELRVCLAHFGGEADWNALLNDGFDPDDPNARDKNWASAISGMLQSGEYPNLYTDISYTIFNFEHHLPLLRLFLTNELIRERVLFGSDFYMTEQEVLSEKAISIRLRDALGEDDFRQIAETNPERYLNGG